MAQGLRPSNVNRVEGWQGSAEGLASETGRNPGGCGTLEAKIDIFSQGVITCDPWSKRRTEKWQYGKWQFGNAVKLDSFGGVLGRIGGMNIEELRTEYIQLLRRYAVLAGVPNFFGTGDWFCGRQFFQGLGREDGLGMIQVHYIYCALCFYYYYIVICNGIYNSPSFPAHWQGSVWAASNWFIAGSVQSDPLMICICSCSTVLAPLLQLHLRSSGTKRLRGMCDSQ